MAVLCGGDTYADKPCDWPQDEFGYDLGINVPEGNLNGVTIWDESVLRKRHVPAGTSFRELLEQIAVSARVRLEAQEVAHVQR